MECFFLRGKVGRRALSAPLIAGRRSSRTEREPEFLEAESGRCGAPAVVLLAIKKPGKSRAFRTRRQHRSGVEAADPARQARNFAGCGILVNDALLGGPHELGLRGAEGLGGGGLVARRDRLLDLADEGPHAAAA